MRVCASSLQGGNLSCSVDHDLNGVLFQTDDQPYSWCIFDFQECSVRPNYYTLAHRSVVNAFFMRSWQLEGLLQQLCLFVTPCIIITHKHPQTTPPCPWHTPLAAPGIFFLKGSIKPFWGIFGAFKGILKHFPGRSKGCRRRTDVFDFAFGPE